MLVGNDGTWNLHLKVVLDVAKSKLPQTGQITVGIKDLGAPVTKTILLSASGEKIIDLCLEGLKVMISICSYIFVIPLKKCENAILYNWLIWRGF